MNKIIIIIVVVTVALLFFGVKYSIERQKWLDENCVKIGEISGSSAVGVGIGSNGKSSVVPVYISGKTGYKCSDGLEYWE